MATPFQERSPCQTASYPRVRRAFTGKASCSALSAWRLTTSGSAFANQARRLSSRLLMLLMLKVATLTESLSAEDHPCACGRHDDLLWHLAWHRHHGTEAGAVHGDHVIRVDFLQGSHGLVDDVIGIRGQVPPANHGVHLLDTRGLLQLANRVDDPRVAAR